MIPTFENFQQGQSRLHEGSDDYVATYKTKSGDNIIVTLKGWGKLSDTEKQYEERGFEIYEALSTVFDNEKNVPKEIVVKF
jgi:hypothetical protein|tara:strand:- start:134 stop:376 length:243 start_codon:yes stop_codon:yes gene_type:complete